MCALVPLLFIALFLAVPETPYYLIKKGRTEEAEESLMRLRTETRENIKSELQTICATVEDIVKMEGGFLDIFKSKGLLKALIISLSLVS